MTLQFRAQQLDTSAAEPLYSQIFGLLKSKIEAGDFAFNSKLPAEEALAGQLGVSRITVKRAMNELAAAGYVTRFRGRGTIVSHSSHTPPVRGNLQTPMEHLRQLGFQTKIELKSIDVRTVSEDAAKELFIPLDTQVQVVERVRHLEGAAFSYIVNHTPLYVASKLKESDIAWRPFSVILEEAGHRVVCAEQTIIAETARGRMAQALMLAEGAPVLTIRRVLRDELNNAVQFSITHYRADRYQYHMVIDDMKPPPISD